MNAKDLTLNIAVNLGRVSRWAMEARLDSARQGKKKRINQFLEETEGFLSQLEKSERNPRFEKTFLAFQKQFKKLKEDVQLDKEWAEETLTWANILQHRAKLA